MVGETAIKYSQTMRSIGLKRRARRRLDTKLRQLTTTIQTRTTSVTETAREEGIQTATAGVIKAISHEPKARGATVPMPFHRRVEPQAAMVPPRRLNVRRRGIQSSKPRG